MTILHKKAGISMSLAITAFNQILIMFLIILAGVICYKVKLIDKEVNKKLADIVLMLVNPFTIIIAYQRKFETNLVKGLLISLLLGLATHLFGILFSTLFLRRKKHEADIAIERFAVIYSNCGFIGIPLVHGVFGNEGVFYLTAYMTVFNLVVWTHGMVTVSGITDRKAILKAVLNPCVIATFGGFILFVSRITLPDPLFQASDYLASMNTPLAMLVAGVTIAQTDFRNLIKKIRIYYIAFLKLLFVPIVMLLMFSFFHIPRIVLLTSVLLAACPTGATISLFAIKYGKNYRYASELFTVSTILCLFTIPIVMIIANLFVS